MNVNAMLSNRRTFIHAHRRNADHQCAPHLSLHQRLSSSAAKVGGNDADS
jgi:hypothetical protein